MVGAKSGGDDQGGYDDDSEAGHRIHGARHLAPAG